VTHSAERVSAVVVDGDRSTWAVTVVKSFVYAFISIRPDFVAGHCIEAVDSLELSWDSQAVGNIDAAVGDGRPAIAARYFSAPADWQLPAVKFLHNTFFLPETISIRASPLGPICGRSLTAK